jgi:hypothetical protein
MTIITTATIYNRRDGSSLTLPADQAALRTYYQRDEWSSTKPPPLNWQFEIPRYRLTRDLLPAQKARFRFEPPFAETWDSDVWQYGERPLVTGEEIETTAWPHPSMRPMNYSGEQVLAFFRSAMKSRLTVSPWLNGQVRLDNGLSNVPLLGEVRTPKLQPFDTRPAA